jgi:hypothetical protein
MADTPQSRSTRQPDKTPAVKAAAKPAGPQTAVPAPLGPEILQSILADPLSATPAELLQLQRRFGNAAVQQLLQRAQGEAAEPQPVVGLEGGEIGAGLQDQINAARGSGQALDGTIGTKLGAALGADFGEVRVHADAEADALNRSLGAQAFTVGSDVFFSQGAYDPGTASGQRLLAHELTHVVQQGGTGAGSVQAKLTVGPADDQYEQEADRVADMAMRPMAAPAPPAEPQPEEAQRQAGRSLRRASAQTRHGPPAIQRARPRSNAITERPTSLGVTRPRSNAITERPPSLGQTRPRSNAITERPPSLEGGTRPRSNAITERPPSLDVRTRPRSNAITERPPSLEAPTPAREPFKPPTIDPVLSQDVWNENKTRRDKITKKTGIGELTRIVTLMHRDVRWAKFDVNKAIQTGVTDAQRQAEKTIKEANEAEQEAIEDYEIKQAQESRVKAELDLAKANTKQAQGALEAARAELRTNVTRLLSKVNELVEITAAFAAKGTGSAGQAGQMRQAAQQLQSQLERVPDVFKDFEQSASTLKQAEEQAAAGYRASRQARKAKKTVTGMTDEDEGETTELEGEDLLGETTETEETETETAPETEETEEEPSERKLPVAAILGQGWFRHLAAVRFHTDPDVERWTVEEAFAASAKDGKPDGVLERLQMSAAAAVEGFGEAAQALEALKGQVMARGEALAETRKLWVKVRDAFDLPGGRRTGIVRAHKEWLARQATLAGSQRQLETWKRENPDEARTLEKVEKLLKDANGPLQQADAQLNRMK